MATRATERRGPPPEPPGFKKGGGKGKKKRCGAPCHMYDKGECWGYGDKPVEPDDVCSEWAPEPGAGDSKGGQMDPTLDEWLRSLDDLPELHTRIADLSVEESAAMPDEEWLALMTTSEINKLPDSAFAYIEPGGTKDDSGKTTPRSLRHYPVQDKPHAQNAWSRASAQIKSGAAKAKEIAEKALPKIKAACKKFGISIDDGAAAAEGKKKCSTCEGSGKIKKGTTKCPTCKGSGEVPESKDDDGPDEQASYRRTHCGLSEPEVREARDELFGVRETRQVSITEFEIREVPQAGGGVALEFEGYASVTCADMDDESHAYDMVDMFGPYKESALRGMFQRTIADGCDTAFLVNHGAGGGLTMARTKPGTLQLHEDLVGLHVKAILNANRQDVKTLHLAVLDDAIDEMSFAFRVLRQKWVYEKENGVIDWRYLQEVSLDKGDVSPVNYGANPHTGGLVSMRSAMVELLTGRGITFASFSEALKEVRAGKTISAASRTVLEPILSHLAAIDELVDEDQPALAELLDLPNPDEDEDGEQDGAADLSMLTLPDHSVEARAKLAMARR